MVGGGPAGATAAHELACSGVDVALFDRQVFPRQKLCAGLLTQKTIRLIEDIFGPCLEMLKAQGAAYHTLEDYRIFRPGARLAARGRLAFPLHLVDRLHYDSHWLDRARKAGVRVYAGTAIDRVCPETGGVVSRDGLRVQSKMIIAADGVHSHIRSNLFSALELKKRWWPQLAQTIEVKIPAHRLPQRPPDASLYFGLVPWGYAWSFPAGKSHILGICGLSSKKGPSLKEGFQRLLGELGLSTDHAGPLKSHPLPYGNNLDSPAKGRVLFVGDACGLADPLLGEGIYYAHKSGQLAAHATVGAGLVPGAVGEVYQSLLTKGIYNEFRWIRCFRNLMFMGGQRRNFRSLKLFFQLKQRAIEEALQGNQSFRHILWV